MTAKYHGSQKWRPGWADPQDVQNWLSRELFVGRVLNIPCGESRVGDVRADIDPDREPDVLVDVYNLPFEPQTFDTVYFDPPFDYLWSDGWWQMFKSMWALARQRLVVKTPRRRVQTPRGATKDWRIVEPEPGSPQMQVWLFQVFDRVDADLTDF